jgi:hypothetical protein
MSLSLVSYAFIERGGTPPVCDAAQIEPDDEAYLRQHIAHLVERATNGHSPAAEFVSPESEERFHQLAHGTDEEFLSAALTISTQIQDCMHHKASPGLLVFARFAGEPTVAAALLKLEVAERYSAILREIAAGNVRISVVRDRMTGAAELQKGALIPDPRDDSDVVVGDKIGDTAAYFLTGLGVRQFVKTLTAVEAFYRVAVNQDPTRHRSERLALALAEDQPEDVGVFVNAHPELFSPEQAEDLRRHSETAQRPIKSLAPTKAAAARQIIRAGGITITGALADMLRGVIRERLADGRWRVSIVTDTEPEVYEDFS